MSESDSQAQPEDTPEFTAIVEKRLSWIRDISDVEMAFPAKNDDMPTLEESRAYGEEDPKGYERILSTIFHGGKDIVGFIFAIRDENGELQQLSNAHSNHIYRWMNCRLRSYELKHEHKMGGVALRLSETLDGFAIIDMRASNWICAGDLSPADLSTPEEFVEHRDRLKAKYEEEQTEE